MIIDDMSCMTCHRLLKGGNIFMDVNDILGNYVTRYFGAGHKHTTYAIADVKKNTKGNYVALASLDFNTDQWSTKNGIQQVAHVSTIDAITLSCLLIEKVIASLNLDNYFIQKFDFKAGRSAIEDIKNIDMEVMNLIIDEPTISFKTILEGMKVSIVLKKSETYKQNNSDFTNSASFLNNHLKDTHLDINEINYLGDSGLSASVNRKRKPQATYHGLGSCLQDHLSLLEWLIVFSQIGEIMAYNYDHISRQYSNNLWMKHVTATFNEKATLSYPIKTISEITKASIIKMKGNSWRILKEKGSDINNEVFFEAKITHQLPQ